MVLCQTFSYLMNNGKPDIFKLDKTLGELEEAGFLAINNRKNTTVNATTVALFRPVAAYLSTANENVLLR